MKKIKVTVCCGTTCYLMGSSDILAMEDLLEPDLKDLVEFEGCTCMDLCQTKGNGRAPFVMINESVLSYANPDSVRACILKLKEEAGL
jgi:NADH:ubiquinone oxidoreductase subunit E